MTPRRGFRRVDLAGVVYGLTHLVVYAGLLALLLTSACPAEEEEDPDASLAAAPCIKAA